MSSGDGIVERAVNSLGKGFDITSDFRLKFCKGKERLVWINETETGELLVPGFGGFKNVSTDIKCDKGDRTRYQSDILDFSQVINQTVHLHDFFFLFRFELFELTIIFDQIRLFISRCRSFSTRNVRCRGKFRPDYSTPCLDFRAVHGQKTQPTQSI